jgi:hypothetical protein
MTTVIRAAGAADFLALVPRLLGFVPTRSLVLMPFSGNRAAGGLRFDLPDSTDPDEIDRIASTFIGMVCKVSHTDAVAIVVFTDDAIGATSTLPVEQLARALATRADLCGLRLSEALCRAAVVPRPRPARRGPPARRHPRRRRGARGAAAERR